MRNVDKVFLAILAFLTLMAIGWITNAVRFFTGCDFDAPYRCEVERGVGILIPPIGGVAGYLPMSDN